MSHTAPNDGGTAEASGTPCPTAVEACAPRPPQGEALATGYEILAKRSDFLAAAQARRQGTPSFLLQARERRRGAEGTADELGPIRVGFTCSKKVGNAVARNRAKRRLREIARLVLAREGRAGWDYVLVGRKDETASRNFELMQADLRQALARVHK